MSITKATLVLLGIIAVLVLFSFLLMPKAVDCEKSPNFQNIYTQSYYVDAYGVKHWVQHPDEYVGCVVK